MNATILCAGKINRINEDEFIVGNFNNVFNIPFAPTLFSFSLAAVISDLDRTTNNVFEIKLIDNDSNETILGGGSIPSDPSGSQFISTTLTLDLQNIKISSLGTYSIKLFVNSQEAGKTIIEFISKEL